jgi:zinc transport system substrate-binding protein
MNAVSAPGFPRFCAALRKLLPGLALALCTTPLLAAPQVVASIKPLQLIAAAITQGATTPEVLWAQGQDPHHVSLRPSERRRLADADLVLWTGPMLEQPLAGLVDDLEADVVTVQDLPALHLITVDGQPDPHVWVDTANARAIADALTTALAERDPANAMRYRANRAQFETELARLDAELTQLLAGVAQRDWAVYHHALRYLERAFGLTPPLVLADSENNAPGIRTAREVRAQLQQKNVVCMLTEPGINHDEVLTMLDLPALRLVDADVMARDASLADYASYMRSLATTVSQCLGAEP